MYLILKPALVCAFALMPWAAPAEDAALIFVESDYQRLPDAPGANRAARLADTLAAAGFTVTAALDEDAEGAWDVIADFRSAAEEADRVFVFVSGHMVSTARESYVLTRYARTPDDLSVGGEAVALGPILDIAAAHPGQAVVMLAPTMDDVGGEGLTVGTLPEAPQGVTVLTGRADALVRVAEEVMLVPGKAPASALVRPPRGVTVSGFLSDALPFLPAPGGETVVVETRIEPDMDLAWWEVVQAIDSVAAYEAYLDRYPRGQHAADAEAAIRAIEGNAEARAKAAEDALALNRDARRSIQRNLALLGFNPRGIDGIFGPGSRAAITAWQRANGFDANGYLTGAQVRKLADAAAARAAELEAEAAARQVEEERRDRQYWRNTGAAGDEAGLRAYLKRYPDGLYADVAEARLAEFEAEKRAEAAAEERAFWDAVRAEDQPDSYRVYLERYPDGTFVEEARARLDELTRDDDDAKIQAAKEEESRVVASGILRLLVENRLQAAGFNPGPADGRFTDETRRAIRRFQSKFGLEVTGYVTQATMVRLLAVF